MTDRITARAMEEVPMLLMQPGSRIAAGGTAMVSDAAIEVNISELRNLSFISGSGSKVELGAVTTLETLLASMPLRAAAPALTDALLSVGTPEVRKTATLGGNLSQPFAGSLALPLLAANAQVTIKTADDYREISLERFYTPKGGNTLAFDELLMKVSFPVLGANGLEFYAQSGSRTASENHAVCCALRVQLGMDGKVAAVRAFGASPELGLLRLRSAEKLLKGTALSDEWVSRISGDGKLPECLRNVLRAGLDSVLTESRRAV